MRLTGKHRRQLQRQNIIYIMLLLLLVALLGWLSVRFTWQFDWSANNRNSLSQASRDVIQQLNGPVDINVFVNENATLRKAVSDLIARYQLHKRDFNLTFTNPDLDPNQTRDLGITQMGEMLINYQGKQERLQQLSEQTLSNALQRLVRNQERWLVFLSGHGERSPQDMSNHAYGQFAQRLKNQGFNIQSHNLLAQSFIPDNTHVLVIAGPQTHYLPGEVQILIEYVNKGGNLLWLLEPGSFFGLDKLAEQLSIALLPGKIVDANTQMFGIEQADFALILSYPKTPITPHFEQFTVFPQSAGLAFNQASNPLGLTQQTFLQTLARSWTETGPIQGQIQFDANTAERLGPLDIGMNLTRTLDKPNKAGNQQRIVVVGDSDFLANTYLGNGGNLELGLNIINWLSHDDKLVNIKTIKAQDTQLQLSNSILISMLLIFLLLLPLALIIMGIIIWLKRRKK